MLSIRVNVPAELAAPVRDLLESDPFVSGLTIQPGASITPPGDVVVADVPREHANEVIDALMALGIQDQGTITLNTPGAWISRRALLADESAPGLGQDSVVWAEVTERAYADTAFTWNYSSFMILATLLASIAILTDSTVLLIGAMVLGPEFMPIATIGLALVRRRPALLRRALRTLVLGFALSITVVTVIALGLNAAHLLPDNVDLQQRTATSFIYEPNWWSLAVALIAGAAGVLALTSSKGNGLVGVFISVTTIPASGNIALAIAFGVWSQALGSALQLIINVIGMSLAGWATLWFQQRVWRRVSPARARR